VDIQGNGVEWLYPPSSPRRRGSRNAMSWPARGFPPAREWPGCLSYRAFIRMPWRILRS